MEAVPRKRRRARKLAMSPDDRPNGMSDMDFAIQVIDRLGFRSHVITKIDLELVKANLRRYGYQV